MKAKDAKSDLKFRIWDPNFQLSVGALGLLGALAISGLAGAC